ncbi:MAG: aminoacyl-tRNA hydrolase [Myxococcota bacterium]
MHLVVGLGNPGPKYQGHRHNIGFMVVDALQGHWGAPDYREKFKGQFTKTALQGEDVVLLKPQTFMNLSGESAQKAMAFFKVDQDKVLVVHDELDLPFGTLRIKKGGGVAGHNGLKSMSQHCGGADYLRLRFGVGRPPRSGASYVLSDFSAAERAELPDLIALARAMVEETVLAGPASAMNRFHSK